MREVIMRLTPKPFEEAEYAEKVQELVRCKDCQWYVIVQLKKDGTDDRRYKPSYCMLWDNYLKPDFFCADGERRENEHRAYRTAEKIL